MAGFGRALGGNPSAGTFPLRRRLTAIVSRPTLRHSRFAIHDDALRRIEASPRLLRDHAPQRRRELGLRQSAKVHRCIERRVPGRLRNVDSVTASRYDAAAQSHTVRTRRRPTPRRA